MFIHIAVESNMVKITSKLVPPVVPPFLSVKDPHFKGEMQVPPPLPFCIIFSPENVFPPRFQSTAQLITSRQRLAARLSNNVQILVAHMLVA